MEVDERRLCTEFALPANGPRQAAGSLCRSPTTPDTWRTPSTGAHIPINPSPASGFLPSTAVPAASPFREVGHLLPPAQARHLLLPSHPSPPRTTQSSSAPSKPRSRSLTLVDPPLAASPSPLFARRPPIHHAVAACQSARASRSPLLLPHGPRPPRPFFLPTNSAFAENHLRSHTARTSKPCLPLLLTPSSPLFSRGKNVPWAHAAGSPGHCGQIRNPNPITLRLGNSACAHHGSRLHGQYRPMPCSAGPHAISLTMGRALYQEKSHCSSP